MSDYDLGIDIEEELDVQTKHIPMYKVLLHNDDVNSMDYVAIVLFEIFKIPPERAIALMLEAHNQGLALVVIEPLERAELHRDQLQSASLTATIEPE